MNKKLVIIIAAVAGALLLATLIVTLVVVNRDPVITDTNTNTTITDNTLTSTDSTTTTITTTNDGSTTTTTTGETTGKKVILSDREQVINLAKSFTERYGSYSTDNDQVNIEESESFMTEKMNETANRLAARLASESNAEYYGVTTQVATVDIVDFEEGSTGATVVAHTRRTETKGLEKAVTFSQSARLQLKKIGNAWKIDTFSWQ